MGVRSCIKYGFEIPRYYYNEKENGNVSITKTAKN